jgi:hypothetical protein
LNRADLTDSSEADVDSETRPAKRMKKGKKPAREEEESDSEGARVSNFFE